MAEPNRFILARSTLIVMRISDKWKKYSGSNELSKFSFNFIIILILLVFI